MSLVIPNAVVLASEYEPLISRHYAHRDEVEIRTVDLTDEMLAAIAHGAAQTNSRSIARVAKAIIAARAGDAEGKIPRLSAMPEMVKAVLVANLTDGWLYERGEDGHLRPWLVTKAKYETPDRNGNEPYVSISLSANGKAGGSRDKHSIGDKGNTITFQGQHATNKTVVECLTERGFYMETEELKAEYEAGLAHYITVLSEGFTHQYRFSGIPAGDEYEFRFDRTPRERRKVIHDLHRSEIGPTGLFKESILFDGGDGVGPVPTHFDLRVYDLTQHDFIWLNTNDVERYVYDKTLADKIILPEDQRNLLDILTTNLDAFTSDVVEGKSAGNVILAKGKPGVGKTLTAEVYSETIERPLYSIHSGNLGVDAESVRKNLEIIFKRAKRWNAVLLLDEADVFVLERGRDIQQNAIVAEFLRTLEYFSGLMFMTTNRADDIDDAILSRAAAVIDYQIPGVEGIRQVWQVQSVNQQADLSDALIDELVHGFQEISPRDVKMLLRLALRIARGTEVPLDAEVFASCAMFRGLHFQSGSRESRPEPVRTKIRKRVQS